MTVVGAMDGITQQNAAMMQQSTSASHALRQEAEALADLIGRFQIGIDQRPRENARRTTPPAPARMARVAERRASAASEPVLQRRVTGF